MKFSTLKWEKKAHNIILMKVGFLIWYYVEMITIKWFPLSCSNLIMLALVGSKMTWLPSRLLFRRKGCSGWYEKKRRREGGLLAQLLQEQATMQQLGWNNLRSTCTASPSSSHRGIDWRVSDASEPLEINPVIGKKLEWLTWTVTSQWEMGESQP